MRKERIRQLDLIRVISTWGIFTYHFFVGRFDFFNKVGNNGGYTGGIFVAIFFMLSGYCLLMTNKEITPKYFAKRFLTIYPAFWVSYLFYYMPQVFGTGHLFWNTSIKKVTLIQSILGIDGFLSVHGLKNSYIVGEWFLGAIIIIYCLYPLLLKLIKKSIVLFSVIIYGLFIAMLLIYKFYPSVFMVNQNYNLITCLSAFGTGMLLEVGLERYQKKQVYALLGVVTILIGYFIHDDVLCNFFIGCGLFVLMYIFGKSLLKNEKVYQVIMFLSQISFSFFLIHHMMILQNNAIYERNPVYAYVFVLLITIAYSWALKQISDALKGKLSNWIKRYIDNNK